MNVRRFLAAAALAAATLGPSAQAALFGETVEIQFSFGADGNAVFDSSSGGNFVAGDGVETNLIGQFDMDILATSIVITNTGSRRFQASQNFNGFRFRDVNGAFADFADAALGSSTFSPAPRSHSTLTTSSSISRKPAAQHPAKRL